MKKYNILKSDKTKEEMTYEDVCKKLGMMAEAKFVSITTRGTIDFTCGKPQEIKALYGAAIAAGMVPAKKMEEAVTRL